MLWFVAALLFSPVVGGMLVDHCPLRFRFPEAATLQTAWRDSTPRPGVLLLGSSRMATFTQSDDLAPIARQLTGDNSLQVFNAAIPSGDPVTIHFLASKILEAGGVPRIAILEINPDFLSANNMFFTYTIKRQLVAADLPRAFHDILFSSGKNLSSLASSRLTPFYRHRTILLDWLESALDVTPAPVASAATRAPSTPGGGPLPPDIKAEIPAKIPLDERSRAGAAVYGRNLLHYYKLEGYTSEEFEKAVAVLAKSGCKVVLVRTPLGTPLRAMITPEVQARFDAYVQRLQNTYGCQFVDFSARLPDSLFVDVHHGSLEGSKMFNGILAREVIAPAWTKP